MATHKNLDVWKKSVQLVTDVYHLTSGFPKEEIFGLTNQIRRASVSIPSNIAEGAARNSDKELIHFSVYCSGQSSGTGYTVTYRKKLRISSK